MPSRWELLLAAIRSGQLSSAQEAAEMQDSNFAAYRSQRAGLCPETPFKPKARP